MGTARKGVNRFAHRRGGVRRSQGNKLHSRVARRCRGRYSTPRMSKPLVSVIVGVYNKTRYVEECLQSVLAQTYPHFELIVVDDASTDGGADRAAALGDPRIRLVRRSLNSGLPAVPRNEAMRLAHGVFLAFLDADDLWMPDKLEQQVVYLQANPDVGLCHTRCMVIDAEGRPLHERHPGVQLPEGACLLPLLEHCWISISTVMVRKGLADRIGPFDERPELRAREDYDWLRRAASETPFGLLDGCLAAYRTAIDSISRTAGNWRSRPRDYLSHLEALENADAWHGKISRRRLREIALGAAEENSFYWRARGERRKAAWFAWQMVRLAPENLRGLRHLAAALLRSGQ